MSLRCARIKIIEHEMERKQREKEEKGKMDIVNTWIKERQIIYHKNLRKRVVERICCVDGFNFSVQASYTHYCSPRKDDAFPYSSFEIGYPSKVEVLLKEYAEDKKNFKGTVYYGNVPLDVILDVIKKHGGIKEQVSGEEKLDIIQKKRGAK